MNIKFCEIKYCHLSKMLKRPRKSKFQSGKDDRKSIWKVFFKEFGTSSKKGSNNDILGLKVNGETVSDESVLAEHFNEYFINVASKLKEPIEQTDFSKLKSFIDSKISENVVFDLPAIDESFVFKFLSSLDITKAIGLDGIGPRLLILSANVVTKDTVQKVLL